MPFCSPTMQDSACPPTLSGGTWTRRGASVSLCPLSSGNSILWMQVLLQLCQRCPSPQYNRTSVRVPPATWCGSRE